ncbi:MAG: hypothetical protein AAGD28_16950 [Bacteroidota bacterium]
MENYCCKFIFFFCLIGLSTFSCSETELELEREDYTHTLYQSNCTYPWARGLNLDQELANLEIYLYYQGVKVLALDYKHSSIEIDCRGAAACTCPSGAEYLLKLNNRNGRNLLDLNEGWVEL